MAEGTFQVELDLQEHYRFSVRFDDPALPVLVTDEPPPLGAGAGPNPARLLGAAVANCLAASLLFALRKFGNEPGAVHATAAVTLARNEQGRLRVPAIRVDIQLGVPAQALKRLDRARSRPRAPGTSRRPGGPSRPVRPAATGPGCSGSPRTRTTGP